jgi:hypothetical protein
LLNIRKIPFLLLSPLIILNFTIHGFCDGIWESIPGIKDSDLKEVAVDCNNKEVIYVTSSKTIYRTGDAGNTWLDVFFVQANDDVINL